VTQRCHRATDERPHRVLHSGPSSSIRALCLAALGGALVRATRPGRCRPCIRPAWRVHGVCQRAPWAPSCASRPRQVRAAIRPALFWTGAVRALWLPPGGRPPAQLLAEDCVEVVQRAGFPWPGLEGGTRQVAPGPSRSGPCASGTPCGIGLGIVPRWKAESGPEGTAEPHPPCAKRHIQPSPPLGGSK